MYCCLLHKASVAEKNTCGLVCDTSPHAFSCQTVCAKDLFYNPIKNEDSSVVQKFTPKVTEVVPKWQSSHISLKSVP